MPLATSRHSLLVYATLILGIGVSHGCQCEKDKAATKASTPAKDGGDNAAAGCPQNPSQYTAAKELKVIDLQEGNGDLATKGDQVFVHYTGFLTDCTKFDSSRDRGEPFDFVLGAEQVIKGWDQGVAGMKVGGHRQLVIPAELGYGSQSVSIIPPNAVLLFDIELVDVQKRK